MAEKKKQIREDYKADEAEKKKAEGKKKAVEKKNEASSKKAPPPVGSRERRAMGYGTPVGAEADRLEVDSDLMEVLKIYHPHPNLSVDFSLILVQTG